ncbi:MAG: CRISPR-associated endonuclease Cas2 [Gordonibacter sp.]
MRVFVFFDLPVDTAVHRKSYRLFRKYLIKEGYLMLQESVYAKLVVNDAQASTTIARLHKHRPSAGLVQALKVTEKQFAGMEFIVGSRYEHSEIDTLEEFVVL